MVKEKLVKVMDTVKIKGEESSILAGVKKLSGLATLVIVRGEVEPVDKMISVKKKSASKKSQEKKNQTTDVVVVKNPDKSGREENGDDSQKMVAKQFFGVHNSY